MVSGPRIEAGTRNLSAGVRKTIQSIKEIVGNHSDADIYLTLKETNMDPNETAQKLLNQDPFHKVQRKKDKRKEVQKECHSVPTEPRKPAGHVDQGRKSNADSDRNLRRGGYGQNNIPGITIEFRVVRDNRRNRNVHEPSLTSRRAANVGAIKHDVGAVGVWRHSSENFVKHSSMQGRSVPSSQSGRDGFSREPFRSFPAISKGDQPTQSSLSEPPVRSISVGKSSLNNRFGSRPNHQPVARHKVPQANKEWKPKSSVFGPGVTGTSSKSASSPANNSNSLAPEAAQLQDKLSHASILDEENVIIAPHIRVSESDRCRLTFGSLGTDVESSRYSGFQEASSSVSAPEPSSNLPSGLKPVESKDELALSSGSISPPSSTASEEQLTDRRESPSPQNIENYANIELVEQSSPSHAPSEPQQQQQIYDPQTGYDVQYFRPAVDESHLGHVRPISPEGFSSYATNTNPATTIPMVQQQAPVPHMYPQVHLSHFANLMPYRQFLSPVYVPPMAVPGYSNNPAYSLHPSSGSSYLLVPGASSPHLTTNGLKYGIQQCKSVPTGSLAGYTINGPGVVGSASGLDDSSRHKHKDESLYVPNPQTETSEHWMNPRDVPSLQSASYYNMPGQTPHSHAAYMPSHTSHASFNASAQSSHVQFPGLYHHSPQPAAVTNPHHMGPTLGGSIGVGVAAAAAPGTQVGTYQHQLGQRNWPGNF